jgi:hypothetical protein
MPKGTRRVLAAAAVLALGGAGVWVGTSNANAAETRYVRIWVSAPAGVGYVGTVCATAYDGFAFDPGGRIGDERCNNSVQVFENEHIDLPIPPEYDGRRITVHVEGKTNELFYSVQRWLVRPPLDFTGEYWDCFVFKGSLATFRFDNHCNYAHPQTVPAEPL